MKKLILTLSLVSVVGFSGLSAKANPFEQESSSWTNKIKSYFSPETKETKNVDTPVVNPQPSKTSPISDSIYNAGKYIQNSILNGAKATGSHILNHKKKYAAAALLAATLVAYGTNTYGFQDAVDLNVGPRLYRLSPTMHAWAKTAANFVKNKMPYGVNMSTVRASANFPAPVTETHESYLVKIRAIQQNAAPKIETDSIIEAAKKVTTEAEEAARNKLIPDFRLNKYDILEELAKERARNNIGYIGGFMRDYIVDPTANYFKGRTNLNDMLMALNRTTTL